MKFLTEKLPIILFVASLCLFSSLIGMVVWGNKLFPYEHIVTAIKEIRILVPETVLEMAGKSEVEIKNEKRPLHLVPTRHTEPGATIHNADAVSPGVVLLSSHWPEYDWRAGLRLIDTEGNLLHHWDVNPGNIWALNALVVTTVHGSYLFPNGDVVFNVEYNGLVRFNSCGEVVWKTERKMKTHHSVFRADNGNFWVSGYHKIEKEDPRAKAFPAIGKPFGEETLVEFSADGELVNEISLLEAIYNSDYKHLLWHYNRLGKPQTFDILHLNDVEVLGSDLADDFPMFDEGDILVSSRALNLVAVVSPEGEVKWAKPGEFTRQHDPDFEPGGWITVFDNRTESNNEGTHLGGTRIVAINPMTNEIRNVYPGDRQAPLFYSSAAGKHQLLDNGNRLITEAQAARVLEVDSKGDLVWEWIGTPYDEEYVSEILEGSRYPNISVEDVQQWPCYQG